MIPNFDRSSTPVLCIDAVCIVFMAIIIVYAIIFFLRKNEQVVRKTGRICCLHFAFFCLVQFCLGRHYLPFLFGGAFLCQISGTLSTPITLLFFSLNFNSRICC